MQHKRWITTVEKLITGSYLKHFIGAKYTAASFPVKTAMNFQERCSELLRAIVDNDLERVKQLLDSGIHVNDVLLSPTRREHATVLGTAAYEGKYEIVQYLLSINTNVNYQDPSLGRNALHWAAIGGKYDIIKLLLERGADINCTDRDNVTAIIRSSIKGNEQIVRFLIANGANVNHHDRLHSSALHYASFFGRADIVTVLIKAGCVQNTSSIFGQGTPLANLFYHGDSRNCTLLVESGYNLQNEHSWIGSGNLHVPVASFSDDLVAYLVNSLTNPQSLYSMCRLKIRESFGGQYVQAKIKRLPLPLKIIRSLLLEDL